MASTMAGVYIMNYVFHQELVGRRAGPQPISLQVYDWIWQVFRSNVLAASIVSSTISTCSTVFPWLSECEQNLTSEEKQEKYEK